VLLALLVIAVCAIRPAKAGEPLPQDEAAVSAIRRLVTTYAHSVDAADPQIAATAWANTPEVRRASMAGVLTSGPNVNAREA